MFSVSFRHRNNVTDDNQNMKSNLRRCSSSSIPWSHQGQPSDSVSFSSVSSIISHCAKLRRYALCAQKPWYRSQRIKRSSETAQSWRAGLGRGASRPQPAFRVCFTVYPPDCRFGVSCFDFARIERFMASFPGWKRIAKWTVVFVGAAYGSMLGSREYFGLMQDIRRRSRRALNPPPPNPCRIHQRRLVAVPNSMRSFS